MTPASVVEWLEERRDNCLRIAALKSGLDAEGWHSDAQYFTAAISLIERKGRRDMTRKQRKFWEEKMLRAEKSMMDHFDRQRMITTPARVDGSFMRNAFQAGWSAAQRFYATKETR